MVTGQIALDGDVVKIGYSALDGTAVENAFDGNLDTLIKSRAANPLELDLEFPKTRKMEGLTVKVGGETVKLSVDVYEEKNSIPIHFEKQVGEVPGYKNITIDFTPIEAVKRIHIAIQDVYAPDPSIVHVCEVSFK